MTEIKTDLRTIRTRKAIVDSFIELLENKDFTSITISEITTAAMINRGTFYRHFLDKYDLLEKAIKEILMKQLIEQLKSNEDFNEEMLKGIFISITNFYNSLSNRCQKSYGDMTMNIEIVLKEELTRIISNALEIKYPNKDPQKLTSIATMLSWMLYGASLDWETNSLQTPEAYFDETKIAFKQSLADDSF